MANFINCPGLNYFFDEYHGYFYTKALRKKELLDRNLICEP